MKLSKQHLVTAILAAFILGGVTVASVLSLLPKSGALSRTCAEGTVRVDGVCVADTYQNREIAHCEAGGVYENDQCSLSAEVCSETDESEFSSCYSDFLSGFGADEIENPVLAD